MRKSEFIDRLHSNKLSRRDFNRALAAAGLALTTMPLGRKAFAEDQAIYFTWAGYDDPGFFPAYVKKHGANPEMPVFADSEEARTKVQSGFVVDVDHPCSTDVKRWRDADLIQPIDTSRLSNWGDVFPQLKTLQYITEGDKQFFIPIDWVIGTLGAFCGVGWIYFLWRANSVTLQHSFDLINQGGDPAESRALNKRFKIAAGAAIAFGVISFFLR